MPIFENKSVIVKMHDFPTKNEILCIKNGRVEKHINLL